MIQRIRSTSRVAAVKAYRLVSQLNNRVRSQFHEQFSRVYYVSDRNNWSIEWDGRYISDQIRKLTNTHCQAISLYKGITNQVVHFGSRNNYLRNGIYDVHPTNRVVLTWFHGNDSDPNPDMQYVIKKLPDAVPHLSKIVTSSKIARERLLGWGVPEAKLVLIPLGVDLNRFIPGTAVRKRQIREKLGIPDDAICIGSFQKDGVGKRDGLEPKLVKGPDIFLETLEFLSAHHNVFVLLTGPARGYVKQRLDNLRIPYVHAYLDNYEDIVPFYHCIDLYLVTSRDEGGPKAILECMATGVPIISTRVGMAADLISNGENGLLVEIDDSDAIAKAASTLIRQAEMRAGFIEKGLITASSYDWGEVAMRYYQCVYRSLLKK